LKFSLSQDYPAGLDRLWAIFGQANYPEQKYRSLGSTAVQMLRFTATEKLIEVELERKAPVAWEKIPHWARKFIGSEQTMHHHTKWRRVSPTQVDAELDIAPVGMPVSAHGTGSVIEMTPKQTRLTLSFDVECKIPGLGAKVSSLFAEQVKAALQADHIFTLRYIREAGCGP
jgi:Protein of unknown function (DUF2505)